MQVTAISFTDTHIPTANAAKEKDTELQKYLYRIHWETSICTNAKLKMMLAASCLRFLEGLTDIDFVLGLAKEIRRKYKTTMKLPLWYSTDILDSVAEKLRSKSMLPTDTDTINELVNDAQEVITKRRYLSASIS
jgi:hypothetical protein